MAKSPEELAHLEWLGYVQPVGLVVSVPAMLQAQCYLNRNIAAEHARFLNCLPRNDGGDVLPEISILAEFTRTVLGWEADDLKEVPQRVPLSGDMAALEVVLPQYHETLRPTHAVPAFRPKESEKHWMMLVQQLATVDALDEPSEADSHRHWNAAPQAKFERLLRETGVPIGLLSNGRQLRLVYSPRGESSGHATFNVTEMIQVAGRPMFAALHMLLSADRMFSLGDEQRLPAILQNSRKYQNTVSTKLAEQVLAALYELMRGFQAANDVSQGDLLRNVLAREPNHVYSGLLTVLMRLVFVMYAEDRDLLSSDPVYSNYYSVTGLFNRLREDAGRFHDTMDQRFGSWSQLITLFRLIYEGGQHGEFKIPARKGYLFDPERYPFLERRQREDHADTTATIPRIPDGVVYRVLRNLLILDGERLSYRTLDVEQIGSVYETVMGFNLEVAAGKSIAIKPTKTHGAPATVNLDALLETKGKDRAKWLKTHSDQTLGTASAKQLKEAETIEQLLEALDKKIAKKVTPRIVPTGAIVLQPSDERRTSGSHYTPRSLTEPIVRTTLKPILKQLTDSAADVPAVYQPTREDKKRYTQGELAARVRLSEKAVEAAKQARAVGLPHPSQILDLKICDPAMGSGAFLVEACRQLGDELVKAWHAHDLVPTDVPPDEDEVLYARRLVAQRCLYGVDKNPMSVDLAKLSLWLVTLAKDHAFTFLDHSLRHGDSLVGLTREQIIGFHWDPRKQRRLGEDLIQDRLDRATEARAKILNAREDAPYRDQEQRLAVADEALNVVRLTGDACVSAFFAKSKQKEREERREELFVSVSDWYSSGHDASKRRCIAEAAAELRSGGHAIPSFHWSIEFPEVFGRQQGGFDAFVGNPPFLGGAKVWAALGPAYPDWLRHLHANSAGKAVDLTAHFFRRCFSLARDRGAFGLIATNTIAQGDTREAGLREICLNGGVIFHAVRRLRWPGQAAVIVSVVYVAKSADGVDGYVLDGVAVPGLNSFLSPRNTEFRPRRLRSNRSGCFRGCDIYGQGFLFSDEDKGERCTPIGVMEELVAKNPANALVIFPYIGGKEINTDPAHRHHRYAVNFAQMSLAEAGAWPELLEIVREKVKPERDKLKGYSVAERRRDFWWQYGTYTPALYSAISGKDRVLAISQTTKYIAFCFLPTRMVFSHKLLVFPVEDGFREFAILQSRLHDIWAVFLGSSMKDDPVYSPPDCFETFPFPINWQFAPAIEATGKAYYEHRASLLVRDKQGLTETYNCFHDPHIKSAAIVKLRELHDAMDRAVLESYGWDDLAREARCEFLLDYEEEDDEDAGTKKSKSKKKPWRLRWPDEFRDEVLARLLELNEQRHKEELIAGQTRSDAEQPRAKKVSAQPLFDHELDRIEALVLMIVKHMGRVTRRAVGEAVTAMKHDKLRRSRLGLCSPPKRVPVTNPGMDAVIGGLLERGWLEKYPSPVQQVLQLGPVESPLGKISPKDQQRLEQTRLLFQQEVEAGTTQVTITEGITDARPGFVSVG